MKNLILRNIFLEKCPNCGKGDVFEKNKSLISLPVTKEKCNHCDLHYEKEPGFFIGAMYVSYGITVFEGIITFVVLNLLFSGLSAVTSLISIATVIVLLSIKNFKWARIIYIRIFLEPKK